MRPLERRSVREVSFLLDLSESNVMVLLFWAAVDLATFVMLLEVAEGKEFGQRMCLVVAREVQSLTPDYDPDPRKAIGVWSRFMSPILGVGLAAAHSVPRCS